mgnify:CR=1 FL=1
MKITIFNGSPHGENGNTNVIVKEFLKGAIKANAEVENIFLVKEQIEHCLGCSNCWIKTPGRCVIKDDMQELLEKFISSDIVGFATPIYFDNVTGIMKNFIDRLTPLVDPHFEKDEGVSRHLRRFKKYPKFLVISNCGFPEQEHFQILHLLFKKIARSMHTKVIAEIYRGQGELLTAGGFKKNILEYKKIVRKAGEEVVNNLRLSEDTILQLEKPIIPDDQYIKLANQNWDKLLLNVKINR